MGAIDPQDFMSDLYDWAQPPDRNIGAKLSVVKIRDRHVDAHPWGHGAYSEGGFAIGGTTSRNGEGVAALTGRFQVAFSDRESEDGDCLFDRHRTDLQDITLFKDGQVRVVLQTWGSTVLWLDDVACYSEGFLTGVRREGNGDSLVSLALRKQLVPSGGWRWPFHG